MKIAIFGGRFDPIHNGHVAVAREVLKMNKADEVWFSIENQHQWRPIVAGVADRKKMAELAIQETTRSHPGEAKTSIGSSPKDSIPARGLASDEASRTLQNDRGEGQLKVDMTPVELGGTTETIAVVRHLRKKYPRHEFVFVVGSDQLPTFHKWSHWKELLAEVPFLLIARKNSPIEHVPANAAVITDPTYEPLADSATRIRQLLKEGKSIAGLVPQKVEDYIMEKGLYR